MGVLCLPTAPFPLIIPNILWQTSHMNRLLILPVLLLTLVVGTPAFSADFQKGLTAAQSGDYATALREWTPLAEQGNAAAQGNLGMMYAKGDGVPQDNKTAVKWYKLAAEQGVASAQSGDFATALREWTPLAKQVDADAQIMLVRCISGQNWIGGCLSRSSHEI